MKLRIDKKVNDELLYCKICNDNKKFLSLTSISAHITSTHKIKTQNYYDKYIKTMNEGKCLWCGKTTNYRNWQYFKYCNTICKNAHYYSIKHQCMLRNKVKIITSKRFINYVNKKYGNNFKNTLYVKKDKE